jgi:putative sigma-54 modulation protein
MHITISFKQLEHTEALDQKIKKKSMKLNKFFRGQFQVDWVCWCDEKQAHWAEVKVHGHSFDFYAKACSDSMYKTLDLVVDKIEKQMNKQKTKMRNKVHKNQSIKYQIAS